MTIYKMNKLFLIIKGDVENVRRGVVGVQSLLKNIRINSNVEIDELI